MARCLWKVNHAFLYHREIVTFFLPLCRIFGIWPSFIRHKTDWNAKKVIFFRLLQHVQFKTIPLLTHTFIRIFIFFVCFLFFPGLKWICNVCLVRRSDMETRFLGALYKQWTMPWIIWSLELFFCFYHTHSIILSESLTALAL